MTDTMTLSEFKDATDSGQIFTVEFIKRSNGELRSMTARRGVKKGVKGVGMSYNPADHNLLTVYDMKKMDPKSPQNQGKSDDEMMKGAFRNINLDALIGVKMNGKTYSWNNAAQRFESK